MSHTANVVTGQDETLVVGVGEDFTASLEAPIGLTARLGARVEVPGTRAIVSAWQEAALEEDTFTVTLEGVLTAGRYNLVWRTDDAEPPEFELFLPLQVGTGLIDARDGSWVPALGYSYPLVDLNVVRPTVEDVARLERSRTNDSFGNEFDTFTEDTRPTAVEVEAIIGHAVDTVLGGLPDRFPEDLWPAAKRVLSLYAALTIEGSYFREQNNFGNLPWEIEYRQANDALRLSIDGAITQNNLLGAMEPRYPGMVPIQPARRILE